MMRRGFSLVELSIVLVILGLLVGGILAGRSLIRASELRQVSTDLTKTRTSWYAFRDKYFALPGDIPNATAFWGAADTSGTNGECADILTSVGTGTQTCNGSGDSMVNTNERYRVWQHLANAGLVAGEYSGIAGPAPGPQGHDDIPGTNLPTVPGAINKSGQLLVWITKSSHDAYYSFNSPAGHYVMMAKCCHGTNKSLSSPILTAPDTWNIDTKVDDGQPFYGRLQPQKSYWSGCTTANAVTAEYDLAATAIDCKPLFRVTP